jgi:2-desacetyl-2-hydroxyethyl bacteriochlorophyllide A dehydrogenase
VDTPLAARQVRVRTLYSGISAGTELASYRGSNPYLHKHWDAQNRLFLPASEPSLLYPITQWGYEEVGEVVETGAEVTQLSAGQVVYGTWGHRSRAVLEEDFLAKRIKPQGLDPVLAIYSHIGPIAINAILDANIHIGEHVIVFGMGVLGQAVAQLARQSGATVYGVDLIQRRLDLARELGGVDAVINPRNGSAAEQIKRLTGGRGADVAIEITGAAAALNEAIRSVAYNGRVVASGFYQGGASQLFLGEEFHHNRVQIVCSQISNVDPALSHRWDRLRMIHTFMDLQERKVINMRPVITNIIPFEQAAEAYRLLDETPDQVMQVVLDFTDAEGGR